jgi:dephospho-CoA kinase
VRVGLTGGIGSGKSLVSILLAERGAVVIDYDLMAREAVAAGTPGLAAIVERFGTGVLHADGTLNRPLLGPRPSAAWLGSAPAPLRRARSSCMTIPCWSRPGSPT